MPPPMARAQRIAGENILRSISLVITDANSPPGAFAYARLV